MEEMEEGEVGVRDDRVSSISAGGGVPVKMWNQSIKMNEWMNDQRASRANGLNETAF